MSTQREPVSRACLQAGNKNTHCESVLKHELQMIEKEKKQHLQNIHHEAKQFRQQFAGQSPSSGLRPGSSTTPRVGSARSGRGSPPRDSCGATAKSSPMLARRVSSPVGRQTPEAQRKASLVRNEQVFVTEMGSNKLVAVQVVAGNDAPSSHHATPGHATPADHGSVPQIIVSDTSDQPRGRRVGSAAHRPGSGRQRTSSPGSPARSDSGSEAGSPLSQSLNLPPSRLRSNSMPSVVALPSIFKPPPRRPSYCPDPGHLSDLHVPDSARNRSSSFSGIQPARRRGSIVEQWGSISERNRPKMGSFKGRRGSVDMENLLRDLSFGVEHNELMSPIPDDEHKVTDRQWEELKKCRYLRIPSKENSEEDVSQDMN